mmetsp:Transcript_115642/g.321533  ORF Transcript_115642/g.321533 Transcript_115642/m.321533 type:complete len:87 (+) Transcript_115642:68-328(+)
MESNAPSQSQRSRSTELQATLGPRGGGGSTRAELYSEAAQSLLAQDARAASNVLMERAENFHQLRAVQGNAGSGDITPGDIGKRCV